MNTSTMMTGPADQACPGCGDTTGMQPTPGISPRVKAWSCTACQTNWATTTVNPQPYFEQLGATRSVLRAVITLADDAATLPDKELRAQDLLRGLATRESILTTQQPAAVKLAKQAGLTV